MKKILAIVLVLVMVLTTGCGASAKFEKGSIKDSVYTNETADLTFTLPEGWTFSSEEELKTLMDQAGEVVGEDTAKAADITTLYDCMAVSADQTANIIFMYENTALSGNADISAKDYADAVIDGLLATSATTGLNYQVGEAGEIEIAGKTYYCGVTTVDLGEGVVMEQRYVLRKLDKYMLSMCITTFPGLSDTSAEDIIAAIS